MIIKEYIKKILFSGNYVPKLQELVNQPKSINYPQDDWTLRVEKVDTIFGTFFTWKGDTISEQLKEYSAHTRNELAMIKMFIAAGDNILDIGAHIGTFSIPFSLFNRGKGKIYAFEANPENYNLLRINIVENNASDCIIPHLSVVTNVSSGYKMFLPEHGNSGMYSFLPDKSQIRTDNLCTNIDIWHNKNHKNSKINFIKIDVEGAEVSVLESCQNLIKEQRPILYIEINEEALSLFNHNVEDVERLLQPYDYHFYRNIGSRNSSNDEFTITRLLNLKEGGTFFDFIAVHPHSLKYPRG